MAGKSPQPEFAEDNLAYLVHDVARLMRREFDKRVKQLGLTRAQWTALAALLQHNGLTQTELAFMLDMGRAPLGTLIDRMQRDGWVERRPDPNDRRVNRVYTTARIKPLLEQFSQANEDVHGQATAGLPAPDRKRLMKYLQAMKANLASITSDEAG